MAAPESRPPRLPPPASLTFWLKRCVKTHSSVPWSFVRGVEVCEKRVPTPVATPSSPRAGPPAARAQRIPMGRSFESFVESPSPEARRFAALFRDHERQNDVGITRLPVLPEKDHEERGRAVGRDDVHAPEIGGGAGQGARERDDAPWGNRHGAAAGGRPVGAGEVHGHIAGIRGRARELNRRRERVVLRGCEGDAKNTAGAVKTAFPPEGRAVRNVAKAATGWSEKMSSVPVTMEPAPLRSSVATVPGGTVAVVRKAAGGSAGPSTGWATRTERLTCAGSVPGLKTCSVDESPPPRAKPVIWSPGAKAAAPMAPRFAPSPLTGSTAVPNSSTRPVATVQTMRADGRGGRAKASKIDVPWTR